MDETARRVLCACGVSLDRGVSPTFEPRGEERRDRRTRRPTAAHHTAPHSLARTTHRTRSANTENTRTHITPSHGRTPLVRDASRIGSGYHLSPLRLRTSSVCARPRWPVTSSAPRGAESVSEQVSRSSLGRPRCRCVLVLHARGGGGRAACCERRRLAFSRVPCAAAPLAT